MFVKIKSMHFQKGNLVALVIALVLTGLFGIYYHLVTATSTVRSTLDWSYDLPEEDTAFGGLFAWPDINDSLPHFQYKKLADSIDRIKKDREMNNNSISAGRAFGPIGAYYIAKNTIYTQKPIETPKYFLDSLNKLYVKYMGLKGVDSIKVKEQLDELTHLIQLHSDSVNNAINKQNESHHLYYFGLNGYKTLEHQTRFFIQDSTYNLAYVKWDRMERRKYDSTQVGHYERKAIPVRFSKDDKRILIPITKKQHTVLDVTIKILQVISFAMYSFIFIGLPVQVLLSISKGSAFNEKNIARIKLMSYLIFALTLISTISPYLLHFVFRNQISADFVLEESFFYSLFRNLYWYGTAIALFIVAKAFQKGHSLQAEQDLTV